MSESENDPSRAREAVTPDKEQRIRHIEGLMRELKWQRGKTYRELAAQWGLHEDTVSKDSAEASRRVSAAVMDPESVNACIGSALERAIQAAFEEGDTAAIAKLADVWAKVSGSGAPERHIVAGNVTATPEAAAAMVRQKFGSHALRGSDGDPAVPPDAK